MNVIYLQPLSGYATPLRSDTLWGMLCWGIRHLWGEQELVQFLDACKAGQPPFVISSAFPYKQYKDEEPVLFFRNPLHFPEVTEQELEPAMENAHLRKVYKEKFAYVNGEDFGKILKGELKAGNLCDRLREIVKAEEALEAEAKKSGKRKKERTPSREEIRQTAPRFEDFSMTHNTIDRLRGGTLNLPDETTGEPKGQLFHSPEIYWSDPFSEEKSPSTTGIFFLADGKDMSKLESVLRLFRHWGFGADRSSGKGFFDFNIQENFALPQPAAPDAMLNLSLFRPSKSELNVIDGFPHEDERFQYRIELRQGYLGHYRVERQKTAHRYFTEGSVFPSIPLREQRWLGGLVKQFDTPHEVWDNGFGFMVNLKWQ